MPRYFTQYWTNETWDIESEEDFDHTADDRFRERGISIGDFVYLVTVLDGQMLLGSRMKVAKIVDQAEAERLFGMSLYPATDHLIGQSPFKRFKKDRPVPVEIAEKLRFVSKTATRLKFKSPGVLDNQTLREIRELTGESAKLLDSLLEIRKHEDKKAQDWTDDEVKKAVECYFEMLVKELKGQAFSKTAYINRLLPQLNGRSKGALEFKLRNISAVLNDFRLKFLTGSVPAANKQHRLTEEVSDNLERHPDVADLLYADANAPTAAPKSKHDRYVGPEPTPKNTAFPKTGSGVHRQSARGIDFAARDARNKALGKKGEDWVVENERLYLKENGRADLIGGVKWVGDQCLGYDVESFELNGKPKFIEVKTTNSSNKADFWLSSNEFDFAEAHPGGYYLYRLYQFSKDPRHFVLKPPLKKCLDLVPSEYRAHVHFS